MGKVGATLGGLTLLLATACQSEPREPAFTGVDPAAFSPTARNDLARIDRAVRLYADDRAGRLPRSLSDLVAEGPPEGGRYLASVPLDPWGRPYSYAVTDHRVGVFDLRSYGPDSLPGTEDDLVRGSKPVIERTWEKP